MDEAVDKAAVIISRSVHPFSLAFLVLLTLGFKEFTVGEEG